MRRHFLPRNGAAESFISFFDEMDSSHDSSGITVPESVLSRLKEEPIMQNDTRIAVDVAKAIFVVAVSDRPGRVAVGGGGPRSWGTAV